MKKVHVKIVMFSIVVLTTIGGVYVGLQSAANAIGANNVCWGNMTEQCILFIKSVSLPYLIFGLGGGFLIGSIIAFCVARLARFSIVSIEPPW